MKNGIVLVIGESNMPKFHRKPWEGNAVPKVLERELATLEKERNRLKREHAGKFVLIHGGEVIGTYDDFDKAADEGIRLFGREPFLIRQVGAKPVEIPAALVYGLTGANP